MFRGYGPDPTDLFLHDGGAFGIKTRTALRLIRTPAHSAGASFAFAGFEAAGRALSAQARKGLAEEAYVLDPGAVAMNLERERSLRAAWTALRQVTRITPGLAGKAQALASPAAGGRGLQPDGQHLPLPGQPGTQHAPAAAGPETATGSRVADEPGGARPVMPGVVALLPRRHTRGNG